MTISERLQFLNFADTKNRPQFWLKMGHFEGFGNEEDSLEMCLRSPQIRRTSAVLVLVVSSWLFGPV